MTVADKSYLAHVARGGELLRADRVDEARVELERANALRPGDARIMNLLGLTYFRLGRYGDAQAIYTELVKRSPKDASLRLNLGLVHLKRGDVDDAIRELTRARELDPKQLRTMGYLGLAFARKGKYALARDAFHTAGQDELAKEMDNQLSLEMQAAEEEQRGRPRPRRQTAAGIRAIEAAALPIGPSSGQSVPPAGPAPEAGAPVAVAGEASAAAATRDSGGAAPAAPVAVADPAPVPAAVPVALPEPVPVAVPRESGSVSVSVSPSESASVSASASASASESGSGSASASASRPAVISARPVPASGPTIPVRPVPPPPPVAHDLAPESLALFVRRRLVRPDGRDVPFEIAAAQALIIRVKGRVYTRTAGVLVSGGHLAFEPVQRRTRGRQTGEPFGIADQAVSLVSGSGHLVALPRGGVFAALELDGEVLYLREELVYAFEERLSWENGHVPGSNGALPIIQLRGEGAVAVRSHKPLLGLEVHPDRIVRVAAAALAGWTGQVVPRLGGGDPATVECAGEGAVLVEEP